MSIPNDIHFLVVEDSAPIREVIIRSLYKMGFNLVEGARDVAQAKEKIESYLEKGQTFDFIVSDLNMPGMSGMEFLKEMRLSSNYRDKPFLLVTTESEKGMVLQAVTAGVSEYVVKPFDQNTFAKKVMVAYKKHMSKAS